MQPTPVILPNLSAILMYELHFELSSGSPEQLLELAISICMKGSVVLPRNDFGGPKMGDGQFSLLLYYAIHEDQITREWYFLFLNMYLEDFSFS